MNIIILVISLLMSLNAFSEEKLNDIWGEESAFMKDESQATIRRHMAKQRALQANMTKEQREEARKNQQAGCGSVNIGNASSSQGDAEAVVIIRGDVINANNNCK